ncbi:hypothetical protein Kyoto68B_02180 [Helicobacter pylori]
MGLKNKIKGFIKERMPFVVRYVRSLKGTKAKKRRNALVYNDLIPLKDFKKHHADLIGTRIEESMLDEKRILEMYQKFNLVKE